MLAEDQSLDDTLDNALFTLLDDDGALFAYVDADGAFWVVDEDAVDDGATSVGADSDDWIFEGLVM